MMMLSDVAKILKADMRGHDVAVLSVGTDSRSIQKGQLFIGIKGEHFDGNTYAAEAIKQGAAAVIISDTATQVSPAVVVTDTRLALGQLAHHWRMQFNVPLVAVTGSNGKTTVKEMINAILTAANSKVLATRGNLNNDIGLPLTLLHMNKYHNYAVIEMGMNHEGEIRYLTNLAQPKVAVINNAGTAHIGELGSKEAIARAKGEIFEGLGNDGIAVINADDDFADYWRSLNQHRKVITFGLIKPADITAVTEQMHDRAQVNLHTPAGNIQFYLETLGEHNVRNALAACAATYALGISLIDIARGLKRFAAVPGRLNKKEGFNGAQVIDDTYNANPDSMKAAIDVLQKQPAHQVFVMGDMAELGEDAAAMHAEVGAYAKQKGIHQLLAFGDLCKFASAAFGAGAIHFSDIEALNKSVKSTMKANVTVLVKGSRFMKMERVVNDIVSNKNLKEKANREMH